MMLSYVYCRLLGRCTKISMISNAVWCLSNLCRGKSPPPDFSKVSYILIATIVISMAN